MTNADRRLLADLRRALLHLHKIMLDWERSGYERVHGRTSPGDLLRIVMNDPQFAWLRPISELIVRIDEAVEMDAPDTVTDVESIVRHARTLVTPGFEATGYSERYRTALQEHPDAVLAHRAVTRMLSDAPSGGTTTH
jgi:hypothetical protein